MRRTAAALLVMSIVVAIVGLLVVRWFLDTRDADLRRLNCGNTGRQVSGLKLQVEQSILFRDHADEDSVRSYFAKVVPVRRAALKDARGDFERLDCPTPKEAAT